MSTTTDDILAMLAQVEDRQIKCPTCGCSNELYVCYPEFTTRAVGATLTGGLVEAEDNDYIAPPAKFNIPPRLLICGNFRLHDPDYDPAKIGTPGGPTTAPWEWFEYPENTAFEFGASWKQIEQMRDPTKYDPAEDDD